MPPESLVGDASALGRRREEHAARTLREDCRDDRGTMLESLAEASPDGDPYESFWVRVWSRVACSKPIVPSMRALLDRLRSWWQARRTRKITEEAVQKRVQRGAEYLDEVDPGWHRRIDPDALELENGRRCVLGQLHGEFRLGLGRSHVLSLSSAPRASLSPVAYGFKCVEGVSDEWQARDYELLTQKWRAAIRARWTSDIVEASPSALETADSPARSNPVAA